MALPQPQRSMWLTWPTVDRWCRSLICRPATVRISIYVLLNWLVKERKHDPIDKQQYSCHYLRYGINVLKGAFKFHIVIDIFQWIIKFLLNWNIAHEANSWWKKKRRNTVTSHFYEKRLLNMPFWFLKIRYNKAESSGTCLEIVSMSIS